MNRSRSSTLAHAAAAFAVTLQLTGCTTMRYQPIVGGIAPDSVSFVRDGRGMTLHDPRVEGDQVIGWVRNAPGDSSLVRVPNEQEAGRRVSPVLMVGALVGVTALVVGAMKGRSSGSSADADNLGCFVAWLAGGGCE